MTVDQILQQEIRDSELWLSRTQEESTYKRDLKKRIELINWALQNMRNPNVEICGLIEYRMNEPIQEINKPLLITEVRYCRLLTSKFFIIFLRIYVSVSQD